MGKSLVVAEKPQAGKDIARILGCTDNHGTYIESSEYVVTWAIGHLTERKQPDEIDAKYKRWNLDDLPVPTDNGRKVKESGRGQFKVIRDLIHRADIERIINAGDAGREGLLIQESIYQLAGNKKPVDILWASSLTDEAIKKAFNNLHSSKEDEFVNLLREAETRDEADMKYGFNYSRMLSLLYANQGVVLSYGRCQTPLLNLIVKRDLEREAFKPTPYWIGIVQYEKGFKGTLIDDEGNAIKYPNHDTIKSVIEGLKEKDGEVKSYKKEDKMQKAPALLNLAELQTIMGKKYGYSPDKTLELAQKLYETHKIMSYPRTDSRYLSDDLYGEIKEHITSCSFGPFSNFVALIKMENIKKDKTYFNNNKVSDHHALIPTINSDMGNIYQKLSEEERNCFNEVVCSFLAIFLHPYKYESTEIVIDINGYSFISKGNVVREMGWKTIKRITTKEESSNDPDEQILPELHEGSQVKVSNILDKQEMTKAPVAYTPGNIIKLMNKYKIGTSATCAGIIQTLQKRKFIELTKGKYTSTALGRELISVVPEELKSSDLTFWFEENLQKVNSGEITKEDFLDSIDKQVRENIKVFQADSSTKTKMGKAVPRNGLDAKCPKCGCAMLKGKSKSSGKEFVYCSGYNNDPKCDFTIWREISGKKLTDSNLEQLINEGKTSLIKGFISKANKEYSAYLKLNSEWKVEFVFPERKK